MALPTPTSLSIQPSPSASLLTSADTSSPDSPVTPLGSPTHVAPFLPQYLAGGSAATAIRLTTPLRNNSASVRSQNHESHASIDHHLDAELKDAVSFDVPHFIDRLLLPSDPVRFVALTTVINDTIAAIASPPASSSLRANDVWTGCTDYAEAAFLPAFARLCHALVDLSATRSRSPCLQPPPARLYLPNGTKYLEGSNSRRKVDFYVAPAGAQNPLQWQHILLLGEMKNRQQHPTLALVVRQIGGHAREIFFAQPNRRFVHALYLSKAEITLFRFDRCGALASERFDMHRNWETLVRVLLAYAYMDDIDMGFDPSFSLSPITPASGVNATTSGAETIPDSVDIMTLAQPPPPSTYTVRVGSKEYRLGRVLDSQKVLAGRATTCWEATLINDDQKRPNYVIKDSWCQTTQQTESSIYDLARQHQVEGLLDLVTEETVRTLNGQAETVLAAVRRGCAGKPAPARRGKKRRAEDTAIDKDDGPPVKQTRTQQSSDGRGLDMAATTLDKQEGSEPKAPVSLPLLDRIRVRLVFRDAVGTPLSSVPSAQVFFAAIHDAILCHRDLYKQAGILHRDISIYNILATTPSMVLTGRVKRAGVLFDFDYAISTERPTSGAQHRTGTLPFLAVSVLNGRNNSYRADLESFFYIMCYGCCVFGAGQSPAARSIRHKDGEPNVKRPLSSWETGDLDTIALVKEGTLSNPIKFRNNVVNHFTPMFHGAREVMKKLRTRVTASDWFTMNDLSEQVEQWELQAVQEQQEWDKSPHADGEEGPVALLRRKLMREEDIDADALYDGMMADLRASLDSGELSG